MLFSAVHHVEESETARFVCRIDILSRLCCGARFAAVDNDGFVRELVVNGRRLIL